LSVGLFADGTYGDGTNGVAGNVTGLFYGDASQLAAECIGVLACIVWVATITFVTFKVLALFTAQRVSTEDERIGLDVPEMGIEGYTAEVGE
jgi:Amt family ammonium transporter